jgi:hypothetical protein
MRSFITYVSPNIIRVIGEMRNAYNILVGKT